MATIYTTQGDPILCDDADYEWLNSYKWTSSNGYAATSIQGKMVGMHRLIVSPPPGMVADHINRQRADNRRSNLRAATISENTRNASKRCIRFDEPTGTWWLLRGAHDLIGIYDTGEELYQAYCEAQFGRIPTHTNTAIPID